MDRPSRRGASKAAKAEAAASKLKQLKEKGGKGRLDDIEEAEDKAVYDVVRARSLQYVVFDSPRSYRADPIVAVATAIGEPAPRARSSRAGTPDEANNHFTSETSNISRPAQSH